jgi:hypothetical protein
MSTFLVFCADLLVGRVLKVQSCMEVTDHRIPVMLHMGHCAAEVPLLTTPAIDNSLNIGQAVRVKFRKNGARLKGRLLGTKSPIRCNVKDRHTASIALQT